MANKFVSGTLILALAGFIVKAVGSVNWIILSRILGGEGIGIYQMAFPVYLLAQEVSGAGIPVALSVLTAEFAARRDFGNVYRLFRLALTVLAITGAILGLLVFFGSSVLIDYHIIRDSRAYYSLVSLVPCIFFTTLLSGYRGYFQGWRQMVPTAVSQIVEQVVRVVAMIGLALWLFPLGTEMAAGGAGLGASVGSVAAFIVLVCFYHRFKKTAPSVQSDYVPVHAKELLFRLAGLAIPVSLAGIMLPLVADLDLFIVPYRLEAAGYDIHQATELYGYLTGMSVPLINLATVFTAAMALNLVPNISHSQARLETNEVYEHTATAVRLALILTVPFSVMLYVLAEPTVTFIYNAPAAAGATQAIAAAVCFLGLHQITTAVLQGLKKPKIPVINMGIACLIKIACNWFWVASPELGIAGAAYATVTDIALAAGLNFFFIHKYIGYKPSLLVVIKTVFASTAMGIFIYFLYHEGVELGVSPVVNLIATGAAGSLLYILLMFVCGGLTRHDVVKLPFAGRFFSTEK